MVTEHHVEGFDAFNKLLSELGESKKIVLYFSGQVNDKGEQWCPDCEKAEPIVKSVIKSRNEEDFIFIHVSVGSREEWKNPECKFRTDPRFKLTSVPTLMVYKAVERLNDVECQDRENISALLENL